jgi:hypothetical protein
MWIISEDYLPHLIAGKRKLYNIAFLSIRQHLGNIF